MRFRSWLFHAFASPTQRRYHLCVKGFGSRRQIKGLETITERLEFTITDSGTIEALIPEEQLAWWMSRVLRMFVGIAEWQAERIDQHDTDFALTDEVERLLRIKAPDRTFVTAPKVKLKGIGLVAFKS